MTAPTHPTHLAPELRLREVPAELMQAYRKGER